jgi:glycosyltransferase involved in cell wall biosynthesis
MHILIISQHFWPENFRINDLALGLLEKGNKITVLAGMPNYPSGKLFPGYKSFSPSTENYQGIKIIRSPIITRGKASGLRLFFNYLSFVFSAGLSIVFKCKEKYDLILVYETSPITQCLPAILFKKIKRIPLILYVQDLWPESLVATDAIHSKTILNFTGKMVRFIYRHCDQILVQSKGFIDSIVAMQVDRKKIHYLPNSAENLYRPIDVSLDASERAQMPKGFCVMFAGNIGAAQDFPAILTAAEKLKKYDNIHFVILGDGRKFSWAKEQINQRELTSTVHLLGRHPMEEMPIYFALVDVLLVTLKNEPIFALTIPAKIQSYLACGKPIIAALNGVGADVVKESGAGFAVSAGNATSLAETILKMFNMSESERSEMGQKGKTYFDANFKRDMLVDKLNTWLEEWKH